MLNEFSRLEMLLGEQAIEKLANSRVAVFGVGGVGGYTVEALARSGVGELDLIDNDVVSLTNINRQIVALHSTIGKYKVDVAKDRVLDINPKCKVNVFKTFYSKDDPKAFDFSKYDYVVDAIDTVTAKLALIEETKAVNVPIICSMGAGNKLNPTLFEVEDISKTSVCPLAKVIRQELRKRKIKDVKVVYSKEVPVVPIQTEASQIEKVSGKNRVPSSSAFVPSVVGLIIASEVVKDLTK